jgi:hypothetical protein
MSSGTTTQKEKTLEAFCDELKCLQVEHAEALTKKISNLFSEYQQAKYQAYFFVL